MSLVWKEQISQEEHEQGLRKQINQKKIYRRKKVKEGSSVNKQFI